MQAAKAATLCCQPSSSGPLMSVTWTLSSATSASPLRCRIWFMIGRTCCHLAISSSLGTCPAWSGCGAASVVKMAYFVARGQLDLLQEPAHAGDGFAEAPGRAEHIQVGRQQLFGPRLPDVMDLDRDAMGGHLLAELLRDHGPLPYLEACRYSLFIVTPAGSRSDSSARDSAPGPGARSPA